MATTTRLPSDFKEFLKLLNSNRVEYLLIGGYAVGYYGYPRPTGDMDIWIRSDPNNSLRVVAALEEFGFSADPKTFLTENKVVRMGVPPFRLELITSIDGVNFADCYEDRTNAILDEVEVSLISLAHLKANKKASGRLKDLSDLENLP